MAGQGAEEVGGKEMEDPVELAQHPPQRIKNLVQYVMGSMQIYFIALNSLLLFLTMATSLKNFLSMSAKVVLEATLL